MRTGKKILAGFLTLAMVLTLVTGLTVPAWAADGEAEPPSLTTWGPTEAEVTGVDGQEYVITTSDSEPDWSQAVEPKDGFVEFDDLTPATAYTIYTRVKAAEGEETGEAQSTVLTTPLIGVAIVGEDEPVVGNTITVTPDPEDAEGLEYQWYYDEVTVDGDSEKHDLTPIEGATEASYTIQVADVDKCISFVIFKGTTEVGEASSPIGPVTDDRTPAAGEAVAPELVLWAPTYAQITGVDGQEYVVAPAGGEPDWSQAVEPKDGFVEFDDLTPATAYTFYTRIKAAEGSEAGDPKTLDLTTDLSGVMVYCNEDDTVVGAVLTAEPEPADAQELTYQWYYDEVTAGEEEGAEMHEYVPIEGATGTTYTIQAADVGKYICVKIFVGDSEVAVSSGLGPVLDDGSTPPEEDVCPKDDTCPISKFSDSKPDAWYHDGVHWALEKGLMDGVAEDKFDPSGTATRAMVVTMLWRLEGEPEGQPSSSFADVPEGSWFEQPVGWAAANGVVEGVSDTAFDPNASVTREQLATILYRYAQQKGQGFTDAWAFQLDFPDAADVADYAFEAMCWMTMNEVIQGSDGGKLAPKSNATRAQIATMFQRFSNQLDKADQPAADDSAAGEEGAAS